MKMPYRAETATGDVFEIEFPLHEDTVSAVRVQQLVDLVLDAIDRDIAVVGETSNGDVLQAMAMALSVRGRMIHASPEVVQKLSADLVDTAIKAAAEADRQNPAVGHA